MISQREKDVVRYENKRKAGEKPDGTTKQAMDKYDKRVASWERAEKKLKEDNAPAVVKALEKTTFNQR